MPEAVWREAEQAYAGQGAGAWRAARAVIEAAGYKASSQQIQKHCERAGVTAAQEAAFFSMPSWQDAEPGSSGIEEARLQQDGVRILAARDQKPTSHLIIPDTQVKPGVSIDHLHWIGRYIAERAPDVVVMLGDWWDMESLSEYDRGKKSFEGRRYLADVESGNRGLELLEQGMGSFKPKRKIMLRGNHEERILRAIEVEPRLEGALGYHHFNDVALGWEPVEFLVPLNVDDIWYSHYFVQPMSGRAYSGTVENILKNLGFSFVAGHQQGIRFARRELNNGNVHIGVIAGSCYTHDENYKGPQGNNHWRGVVVAHEVQGGQFDMMQVSLDFLRRKFG